MLWWFDVAAPAMLVTESKGVMVFVVVVSKRRLTSSW